MKTIEVEFAAKQKERLERTSKRLGVSPEKIITDAVNWAMPRWEHVLKAQSAPKSAVHRTN